MKNIFDFVCLLLLGVLFFFFDLLFFECCCFFFSSWRFCCVQYVSVSACIRCFCIVFCFFYYTRQSTWLFFSFFCPFKVALMGFLMKCEMIAKMK